MKLSPPLISLGFTPEKFPAGVHICQIIQDDLERDQALLSFLLSGLAAGERVSCFSDRVSYGTIADYCRPHQVSLAETQTAKSFTLATTRETYFPSGDFQPEHMIDLLREYQQSAAREGYPAARVIGEMAPEIQNLPGRSRLLEYEAKVTMLLREHPVTSVCQYDARCFDGATIMDVLKVHPLMVLRGTVIRNPFFLPPENFLAS